MIKNRNGFTLVELIIYLVLLAIVLIVGFNLFSFGQTSFIAGSNEFQLQSDLRQTGDFIIQETRNATTLDIVSLPFVAQTDYYYIYLKDSKIIYEHDGSKIEKTGAIVVDQNLFEITKDTNNRNFLGISLMGTIDGKSYDLSTSIMLNNIINKSSQTGKAIGYKKP